MIAFKFMDEQGLYSLYKIKLQVQVRNPGLRSLWIFLCVYLAVFSDT